MSAQSRNAAQLAQAARRTTNLLAKLSIAPILVLLWVVFAFLTPTFATWANAQTILAASAVAAVAAVGETLVLLTGGIDLSIATIVSCSGVLSAKVMAHTNDPISGLAVAVLVGVAFGLVNGVAVGLLNLTPFIVTLGTYLVARGIAFTVSNGIAVPGTPDSVSNLGLENFLGIPVIALIAGALLIAFGIVLQNTSWGRHVYLIGSNEAAARYVGVRHRLVKASAYVVAGALGGVAGFLALAYLGVAIPGVGDTLLLTIIGAVILGGTSLFGGEGSMFRTALGVLLLASLSNGLDQLGLAFYDELILQGLVILVGTALTVWLARRTQRK
jgi:ribose/xylose/arabinose/galactoside ABC-type transport system permease subunit